MINRDNKRTLCHKGISDLIPYASNSRTHSDEQVSQVAVSIKDWVVIGDYAVSECGVIVALPFEYQNRWGGVSTRPARVLAQSDDKDGYKLTTMKRLGWNKNGQVRVHRLVAHCWIGPCPDGMEVNHIDGDKGNNHAGNLEYVTSKQNKRHALDLGLMKVGADHHHTKPVLAYKGDCVIVMNGVEEIEAFGFHAPSVHRVARGERKSIHGWEAEYV